MDILLKALEAAPDPDRGSLTPLKELLRREKLLTPEKLRDGMIRVARETIITGQVDAAKLKGVIQMLFAKEGGVMFELADWDRTLANHPSVWHTVNRVLLRGGSESIQIPRTIETQYGPTDLFTDSCAKKETFTRL